MLLRDFPHYFQIMLGFRLKYPQMIVFSFRIVAVLAQQEMQHCLITYKSIIYKFEVEILFVYTVSCIVNFCHGDRKRCVVEF